jgi:hypothetical protein
LRYCLSSLLLMNLNIKTTSTRRNPRRRKAAVLSPVCWPRLNTGSATPCRR